MERWQNRVAVVTGASSGIGEAIVKDLLTAGLRVVALARRQERLEKNRSDLAPNLQERLFIRKCDISNEADVNTAFDWIESTLTGTDILVNNAGVIRPGNLVEIDSSIMDEVFNVNVKGLIYCIQGAYKSMKRRSFDGHIVNINSVAGYNVPRDFNYNIYCPSKFAVTAINETMRNELRNLGTKIRTTSISPGLVRTEIVTEEQLGENGIYLEPKDISQAVLFAISTPQHVQIHEITVKPVGELS